MALNPEQSVSDKQRKGLVGLVALSLLLVVGLLATARAKDGDFPQLSFTESFSALRTSEVPSESKAAEHQLPTQTLRVLDPGDHEDLLAQSPRDTGVNEVPGGGALNPRSPAGQSSQQSERITSNTMAAMKDISGLNLGNLKPQYPLAANQRSSREDALKTRSPVAASNLPGPGYPVYRPEIVRTGSATSGKDRGDTGESGPSGMREGSPEVPYDETPAYLIFSPTIFPYQESSRDQVLVEFTVFHDSSFHAFLLESSGSPARDQEVLEGLRHWEWEPATKKGKKITTKETVRLRATQLPPDEWERLKAEQERQIELRAKKREGKAASAR